MKPRLIEVTSPNGPFWINPFKITMIATPMKGTTIVVGVAIVYVEGSPTPVVVAESPEEFAKKINEITSELPYNPLNIQ